MEALVHLAHAISPLAAGLLLASVWQGLLLTAVLALALRVLPALSPARRTRLWTANLLLVLLLPALNCALPHSAARSHAQVHLAQGWSLGLLALWMVCASARAAVLAANAFRLWHLARHAVPLTVPESVLPLLRGGRPAVLCASAEINRPSVAGFFRPRVLLPQGLLETLSPAELEHVVLHEMEHLRRWDDWMNLLQQISLVLLPLNPALFWLDRHLCRERELACDDGVLAATQARKAYAACLVRLAEDSLVRKGFALALSALGTRARESEVVLRVRRILAGPEAGAAGKLRFTTGALLVPVLALTTALARSPQWISFDAAAPAIMAKDVEPLQPLPNYFPGRMVPTSARMNSAAPRLKMTSAVLEEPVTTLRAVVRRKTRTRMLPRKATLQTARPWVATPLRTPEHAVQPWSMTSVSAVANTAPAADTATPDRQAAPVARFTVTEFEVSQPIFAAVPVRGGWLILQL